MKKLVEQLQNLKFKKIAIVDDAPANINAAREAFKDLSGIEFTYYHSAEEIISIISENPDAFDLIITDMKMEEDDSGLLVVKKGFNFGIYVVVASGGFEHAGQPIVRLAPDLRFPDASDKSWSKTWIGILTAIIESSNNGISILSCFLRLRNSGADFEKINAGSPFPLGEHVASVVKSVFLK